MYLLAHYILRLGLERGKDAKEALDTITSLLKTTGQGGNCSDEPGGDWAYHNSFLIADATQAWILETVGEHWAAQKITSTNTKPLISTSKYLKLY